MLNDKDIRKLKSVFSTKADFKNLLTKQDLRKIQSDNLKVFATKKDLSDSQDRMLKIFATKQDIQELRTDIAHLRELVQSLVVATDKMAKSIEILVVEYKAISKQLTRHDRWIKQIAEKVGLNLVAE